MELLLTLSVSLDCTGVHTCTHTRARALEGGGTGGQW